MSACSTVDSAQTTVGARAAESNSAQTTTSAVAEASTRTNPPPTATTTTASPSTTTSTTAAERFEISGAGDGSGQLDFDIPPDQAFVMTFTHDGGAVFSLMAHGSGRTGGASELIGFGMGSQTVTVALQFRGRVDYVEVLADGGWTYTIRDLEAAERATCSGAGIQSFGFDVIVITDFSNSPGRAIITHDGDIIGIRAFGQRSMRVLLSERDPFEDAVQVESGDALWVVAADGNWTVTC